MADMIGLLRFGMPQSQAVQVSPQEAPLARDSSVVGGVQGSAGGARASPNYSALPRPMVSPQFAYANAADDGGGSGGQTFVLTPPEPFDTNVIPGPPPTFEATLLELESHLRMSLARMDAARNAHPMDPKPVTFQAPPDATTTSKTPEPAATAKPATTTHGAEPAPGNSADVIRLDRHGDPVAKAGA